MSVRTATLFEFDTPLTGSVTLGRGRTMRHRKCLLIRLTALDGREGWGEASPLPGFSIERREDVVSGFVTVRQTLVGAGIDDDVVWDSALRRIDRIPSLQFGIATAREGLQAAVRPVAADLAPTTLPTARLLSADHAEVESLATQAVESGFKCLKIKVGRGDPVTESSRVRAVIESIAASVSIRLDANRAWTLTEATTFMSGLEPNSFDFIEEPLADPEDITDFVQRTGAAVAVDESVRDGRAENLMRNGSVVAAVIKPTMTGMETMRYLRQLSVDTGMRLVFSCSYESGVGTAAVARLAAGVDSEIAAGLGTHSFLATDVLDPRIDFGRPLLDLRTVQPLVVCVASDRLTVTSRDI